MSGKIGRQGTQDEQAVAFGDFVLTGWGTELTRRGVSVKIQPKPLALLAYLIRNRQRVVERGELFREVWPDVVVSEQALSSALRDVRRAIGETPDSPGTIQTLRGRGFRFAAPVTTAALAQGGVAPLPDCDVPAPPKNPTVLVDRDEPLRTLLGALAAAERGQTRFSFLVGPAGIGKTCLAAEVARRATAFGFAAHWASCYEGDGAPPFWAWIQILRACIGSGHASATRPAIVDAFPQLAWLVPELSNLEPGDRPLDLGRTEARFRLFEGVCAFLTRSSLSRPSVLVLDDLHWADEATLLLLEFAMQTMKDARVLVVGTLRDRPRSEPSRALLGAGAHQPRTECIHLKGLRTESIASVLAVAAGRTPSTAFVQAVCVATSGNPFFLTELARLVASGELDATATSHIPVPDRVRHLVRWETGRLSPRCRELLAAASALGRNADLAVVSHALGRTL